MSRFWKKQVPAFLLTLVMVVGMIPAAAAATADISLSVKAGKTVSLSLSKFESWYDDDIGYIEFTDVDSNMDKYGHLVALDYDYDDVELDASDAEYMCFYTDEDEMDEDDDLLLEDLLFKADASAKKGTFTIEFKAYDIDGKYPEKGTLEISVTSSGTSSSSNVISYSVKEGKSVAFDRDDFNDLFDAEYDEDFWYLEFTSVKNMDDYGYLSAKNGNDKTVKLKEKGVPDSYFYYDPADVDYDDDYYMSPLSFVAADDTNGSTVELKFTMYDEDEDDELTGTVKITIGSSGSASDNEIVYELEEDDEVTVTRADFKKLFEEEYDDFWYLEFTDAENLDDCGYLYAEDWDEEDVEFDESDIDDGYFFYDANELDDDDHYYLGSLTFVSDKNTDGEVVELSFTMYGEDEDDEVDGVLIFEIGDVDDEDDDDTSDADLVYEMDEDDEVALKRGDFKDLFEEEYEDFWYLEFTDVDNADDCGYFEVTDYDDDDVELDEDDLLDGTFYYSPDDLETDTDYYLGKLAFISDEGTDGEIVTLEFTMYNEDDDEVDGVLEIHIGDTSGSNITGDTSGDIRYNVTYGSTLQLNANDFARFLQSKYPSSKLDYVQLTSVPASGTLYYDYFSASDYGERTKLSSSNVNKTKFYFSPSDKDEFALSELTFAPNGFNYCTTVGFKAFGSGSKSVSGEILISTTLSTIPEVYGVTPKNTAVTFPVTAISSAVSSGTGLSLASIRLISLPASSKGTVRLTNGLTANTETLYTTASGGNYSINTMQFVPASGFTGNVEIPYVAYNASGNAVGSGVFSLGVLNKVPSFKDITSSTWCYKYVAEMSDAGVIGGYADGTYKQSSALTYGAALKLIMLAAGYDKEEEPAGNRFINYLNTAKEDGIVSGNVNLSGPITRGQVAELAAKAMGLDTKNLSTVKPFTDTTSKYVQALNAAGIVEGYFSNGTSTFRPDNTLTRGHISAIVWRMNNYMG